jgi:hypothetical protein
MSSVRVFYSNTQSYLDKNGGHPSKLYECSFASIDEARRTSLLAGWVFGIIPVEDGDHVYSARFGWEFTSRLLHDVPGHLELMAAAGISDYSGL